jgi:endonuclease/exonuclease/phosphatase family metal-dependent hydrolase
MQPDVACLQEVVQPRAGSGETDQARRLAAQLNMHVFAFGGELDEKRTQSIAILSRWPLEQTEVLTAVAGRNFGVTGVLTWRGTRLRIVSVHLAGTWKMELDHVARTSRERAADWDSLLERVAAWTEPVIVAGDFNTLRNDAHFGKLEARLRMASLAEATFPSHSPAIALDHVTVSPGLEVVSTAVVESEISDHRPVVVTLRSAAR